MKIDELINKLTDLKAVNGNIDVLYQDHKFFATREVKVKLYTNITAKKDCTRLSPWESGALPDKFILIYDE